MDRPSADADGHAEHSVDEAAFAVSAEDTTVDNFWAKLLWQKRVTETDFHRNAEVAIIALGCSWGFDRAPRRGDNCQKPDWLSSASTTYVVPPPVAGGESLPVLTLAHNGQNHYRAAVRGTDIVHIVSPGHLEKSIKNMNHDVVYHTMVS